MAREVFERWIRETDGQDLIEYAMLAAIIALGVIAAITGVKSALTGQYTSISTKISTGS